jgi:hypothetical protein
MPAIVQIDRWTLLDLVLTAAMFEPAHERDRREREAVLMRACEALMRR